MAVRRNAMSGRINRRRMEMPMAEKDAEDALSGLAPLLRVRPELEDFCLFGGAWTSSHAAGKAGSAYFHMVTQGSVELDRPGFGPLRLEAGDILLLPHGDAHTVRAPGSRGRSVAPVVTHFRNTLRVQASAGVAPETELICGRLHFEAAPQNLVIAALPDVIVLRVGVGPLAHRFSPLMGGIREELDCAGPGALAIAKDLASALFVMMLRAHFEASAPGDGLLRLLHQRVTAQAVLAMLRDPVRTWTLDELAQIAGSSRASLVRAFRSGAGVSPMAFLTDLRLGLARHRLADRAASIERIAAEVGYQSLAAFSRAYLRKYGVRPGGHRPAGEQLAAYERMARLSGA
jgi:AraC family transcriptional regulator, activator of mtrCDE